MAILNLEKHKKDMKQFVNEIGSEFHIVQLENGTGLSYPRPGTLVFSGRTALQVVLQQIPNARTALLPSYCCESMIIPFRKAGIKVSFYEINWGDQVQVDLHDSADILLWCNYFGFRNIMPQFDGIIIEDITHSFLSENSFHSHSDYLVASLRKWEPIYCGGYCSIVAEGDTPSEEFINLKKAAMELKTNYLKTFDKEDKTKYLKLFEESNSWLAEHYSKLLIDSWSKEYLNHIDVGEQRRIRRRNATILYEGLTGKVQFMFPIEDMDCPLFVPILIPNRDEVRNSLIKNEIYCPIHWPKPEGCKSNIYNMELSLICDQRYGVKDMKRIVKIISKMV